MVTNSFGNRNFMQPMGRLSMHSKCLDFFAFKFGQGWGGRYFFIFPSFPICSLQVPNGFPSGSQYVPYVFPIAPCFNPIRFAQSPPLLTYVGGPKGETLHLCIEFSILGSLHRFNFFLGRANQIGSLPQKKCWTCEAPPTN